MSNFFSILRQFLVSSQNQIKTRFYDPVIRKLDALTMPEIFSSPPLLDKLRRICQSLSRICKWGQSLLLPLSIHQIHAHCGVLCLAAIEDNSINCYVYHKMSMSMLLRKIQRGSIREKDKPLQHHHHTCCPTHLPISQEATTHCDKNLTFKMK